MSSFAPLPYATIPAEDESLRAEVKSFLAEALAGMPAEKRARSWVGADPAFSRALGKTRGGILLQIRRRGRAYIARID